MTPKNTYMPVTLEELERRYPTLSLKVLDEQSDHTDKKGYSQKPPMKASTKEELIKEIDDLIELSDFHEA
ncbi:hypothetical protein PG987_014035 [Apiospora arundinis]